MAAAEHVIGLKSNSHSKDGIKVFGKWKREGDNKMDKKKFGEIMKERERIWKECQDNWGDGIDMCCNAAIKLIKEDLPGFITFLKTECSSRDYLYITEWFDEFVEQIKSQELIDAFRYTMENRFPNETAKYNIDQDLDEAIKYYGKGVIH